MGDSEIQKGDMGPDVVEIRAGNEDKSGNRGAGGCSEGESRDLGGSCESKEEVADELTVASQEGVQAVMNYSIVIEIASQRDLGEILDLEKLCRICLLSPEEGSGANASKVIDHGRCSGNHTAELILLGCGCRDDLGMAHRRCAEAWFKLRRNRLCEICGKTAQNVSGVGDNRFMEEWNDRRGPAGTSVSSSNGVNCWSQQALCNLFTGCLVMVFVLPWFFFRVNLF